MAGNGKGIPWWILGLFAGVLIYATVVCGGKQFKSCDGKIVTVDMGSPCPAPSESPAGER